MERHVLLSAILAAMIFPVTARAEEEPAKPAFKRPAYNPVFPDKEDWSAFRGQDRWTTGDIFDPLKFIPLSDDESIWASFGGQARLRFEGWNNFATSETRDDAFLLTRIRLHGDLHVGENFRVFAEGISATSTLHDPTDFRAGGLLDVNTVDLQQAFADLKIPLGEKDSFVIRGGRQELSFGKQRLVSPLDWSNTRRTFEGVKGTANIAGWTVSGFWTEFVPVQKYDFDTADAQTLFYGVYATGKTPFIPDSNVDLYYLGMDKQEGVSLSGGSVLRGDERHTYGGRLWGKIGKTGLDYDLEGAYQNGERNFQDVDAYMVSTEIGYTLANMGGKPRVFAGFDYATGDSDSGDDEFNTFNQLFPLGHAYFGFIDLVGRQNVHAFTSGVTFTPVDKLSVLVQGHVFELAESETALFNAGGGSVLSPNGEDEVGYEIDLLLKYQWDMHTQLQFGYNHFCAGDYFNREGRDDIDFFYFAWEYTF